MCTGDRYTCDNNLCEVHYDVQVLQPTETQSEAVDENYLSSYLQPGSKLLTGTEGTKNQPSNMHAHTVLNEGGCDSSAVSNSSALSEQNIKCPIAPASSELADSSVVDKPNGTCFFIYFNLVYDILLHLLSSL